MYFWLFIKKHIEVINIIIPKNSIKYDLKMTLIIDNIIPIDIKIKLVIMVNGFVIFGSSVSY